MSKRRRKQQEREKYRKILETRPIDVFPPTEAVDESGPWEVVATGRGMGVNDLVITRTLPPVDLTFEVSGTDRQGSLWYEASDPEYVLGSGWKVETSIPLSPGDLLVVAR